MSSSYQIQLWVSVLSSCYLVQISLALLQLAKWYAALGRREWECICVFAFLYLHGSIFSGMLLLGCESESEALFIFSCQIQWGETASKHRRCKDNNHSHRMHLSYLLTARCRELFAENNRQRRYAIHSLFSLTPGFKWNFNRMIIV